MYSVSNDFLDIVKQSGRLFKASLTIRDTIFDDDNIIELDLEENCNPDDSFMLGGVGSSKLEVTIKSPPDGLIIEDAPITAQLSLLVNGSYETVPLGVFTVNEVTLQNETAKIVCYDNMYKLEQAYFSDLSYPASIKSVAQEICSKAGTELASSLPSTQINEIEGYTYREAIGLIASFLGGFARFNRDGALEITNYKDSGFTVDGNIYSKLTTNQKAFSIGRLACKAGTVTDEEGNASDNILSVGENGTEVQFENPIMTQEQLGNIYDTLKDLSYMPYNMDWWGNPAIQAGDKITIKDVKGNTYKTLVMDNKITYKGSITASCSASGKTETASDFSASGTMQNTVDRMVIDTAYIKHALINKASIEDLRATNAKIDNLVVNNAQIADGSITNAKIQNATITGAKIATGTIDTANIRDGAITTALIQTGAINTAQIADGSITDAKIVSLTANKITAGTLDAGVINVVNLNAANITVGKINGKQIEDYAIGNNNLADGVIDNSKIKDGASINGSKLDIGTVFDEMNNSSITEGYGLGGYGLTHYGGPMLQDDKVVVTQEGKSLDLVLANVGDRISAAEIKITPDAITNTVLSSSQFLVQSSQIAQTAANIKIGFNGIDDGVVFDSGGLHINHGSIDAALADIKNINASNITVGLLQGTLIAASTITGDKLVADAITSREIASKTITANNIASNTITAAEMRTGTITAASGVIGSLDASTITTGTLDAGKVDVINLTANKLQVRQTTGITIGAYTIDFISNNISGYKGYTDSKSLVRPATIDSVTNRTNLTASDINCIAYPNDESALGVAPNGSTYCYAYIVYDLLEEYQRQYGTLAGSTSDMVNSLRKSIKQIEYKFGVNFTHGQDNTDYLFGIWNFGLGRFGVSGSGSTFGTYDGDHGVIDDDGEEPTGYEVRNYISDSGKLVFVIQSGYVNAFMSLDYLKIKITTNAYTDYGNLLVDAMPDANGGRIYIYNDDSEKNVTIGSSGFSANNTGGTFILHNNSEQHRVEMGVAANYDSGLLNLLDRNSTVRAVLYANNKDNGPALGLMAESGNTSAYMDTNNLIVGGMYIIKNGSKAWEEPSYTWSGTISEGSYVTITHGLNRHPIIRFSGNVGNIILTTDDMSDTQTKVYCYSSGGSNWTGTIYFY